MAIRAPAVRKHLSADALFGLLRTGFAAIADHRLGKPDISLTDTLMAAFAMISLKSPWKRNRKVALKPRLRRRRGPHRAMAVVVRCVHRPHLVQRGESTDAPPGLGACTSPPPPATPASARPSGWPHVAHSAISPRRASCTPRCSGQGGTATFLLRFLPCHSSRCSMRIPPLGHPGGAARSRYHGHGDSSGAGTPTPPPCRGEAKYGM